MYVFLWAAAAAAPVDDLSSCSKPLDHGQLACLPINPARHFFGSAPAIHLPCISIKLSNTHTERDGEREKERYRYTLVGFAGKNFVSVGFLDLVACCQVPWRRLPLIDFLPFFSTARLNGNGHHPPSPHTHTYTHLQQFMFAPDHFEFDMQTAASERAGLAGLVVIIHR